MSTDTRQAESTPPPRLPSANASDSPPPTTARQEYRRGLTAALPLFAVVAPYGLIYGALGVAGGFSPGAVAAMSALVFAGSAQFLAVGLYAAQTAPIAIVLATLIVNLRHLLYAVTLGQYYRGLTRRALVPLAFTTTDEVFILAQQRAQKAPTADAPPHTTQLHWFALGAATFLYMGWQIATWVGIGGGQLIQDPTALGLDFALPATFIAFLAPQLRRHPVIICALISGVGAMALRSLPLQSGLILAILLGVGSALAAEAIGERSRAREVNSQTSQQPRRGGK